MCLSKLLDFCRKKYNEKPLGKLEKSCCPNVSTLVVDFDEIAEKFSKKLKTPTFSSCDALKILPKNNLVHFIEMKGFCEWYKLKKSGDSFENQFGEMTQKFEAKMKHTPILYGVLIQHLDGDKKQCEECAKQFIFLTDIENILSPVEDIVSNLDFLSITSSSKTKKEILEEKISNISPSCFSFANLQPTRIMYCKDADNYYSKLE